MNIAYIITGLTMGGAETITANLAHVVATKGNNVSIIFLSGNQEIEISEDIMTYNLNMRKSIFGFCKSYKKAISILLDFRPDIVHANMFHAIVFSRLLRLRIKIPKLISTEHSNNYHGNIRKLVEKYTDFLSDLNTNVSEQATAYFIQKGLFSAKKSIAMYNGVDLKKFYKNRNVAIRKELNISDDCYVFINVSRFNEAKDHKNLIDSFYKVHQKYINTKLICVGSGELFEEIKNKVCSLNLMDSVIFTGNKYNTYDYYNASDCFVLSSAWEGFGLVLVEAMACELEVISTDCGGTKEIIYNETDLVPVKNSELLSKKMIEALLHTKKEKEIIGYKNRKCIEKFDLNIVANKWISIYNKDLEGCK